CVPQGPCCPVSLPAPCAGPSAGAHGRAGLRLHADLRADGDRALLASRRPVPGQGALTMATGAGSLRSPPALSAVRARMANADIVVPGLIFGVLAGLPLAALVVPEGYLLDLATRIMIFSIAAVALDLVVGYGALVSFGHAAFIGLGAYAVGILAAHGIGEALVSLPLALAAAVLFALATGAVS